MYAEKQIEKKMRYRCRNDMVLIRLVRLEAIRGLIMPEASIQGHQYVIEEVGPNVEGLRKGDVVIPTGKIGIDIGPLPNDSKLYLTRQENVAVVMEPAEGEET